MKTNFQHIGLARLCGWFGLTRQAYYQNSWNAIDTTMKEEMVIQQVHKFGKIIVEWGQESCMKNFNHSCRNTV